jgi:hypothetical protein
MCLHACDGWSSEGLKEPIQLTSACELAKGSAALDGRLIRFRSEWEVGVEHVRAFDSRCPRINLFLRGANPSVDLTLCSEEGMRFGCPVNPDFKVQATFTGVFHDWNSKGGSIVVISMTEISSESGRK